MDSWVYCSHDIMMYVCIRLVCATSWLAFYFYLFIYNSDSVLLGCVRGYGRQTDLWIFRRIDFTFKCLMSSSFTSGRVLYMQFRNCGFGKKTHTHTLYGVLDYIGTMLYWTGISLFKMNSDIKGVERQDCSILAVEVWGLRGLPLYCFCDCHFWCACTGVLISHSWGSALRIIQLTLQSLFMFLQANQSMCWVKVCTVGRVCTHWLVCGEVMLYWFLETKRIVPSSWSCFVRVSIIT